MADRKKLTNVKNGDTFSGMICLGLINIESEVLFIFDDLETSARTYVPTMTKNELPEEK
jgi:hypothetical protein